MQAVALVILSLLGSYGFTLKWPSVRRILAHSLTCQLWTGAVCFHRKLQIAVVVLVLFDILDMAVSCGFANIKGSFGLRVQGNYIAVVRVESPAVITIYMQCCLKCNM